MSLYLNKKLGNTFSIVMAIKNCHNFIVDSVESLLNQNFSNNYEIIIGDDFSDDKTLDVLVNYLKGIIVHNIDIFVYKGSKNLGCGLRRNCLIEKSNYNFISIADGDDFASKDRLQEQYDILNRDSNIFALSGSCNVISHYGENMGKIDRRRMSSDEIMKSLLLSYENPISDPCVSYRKEIFMEIGGYSSDPFVKLIPDLDLWMRFYELKNSGIIKEYKIEVFENTWVNYRKNINGNTIKFSREMMKAHGMRRQLFNKKMSGKLNTKSILFQNCLDEMELIYEKRS